MKYQFEETKMVTVDVPIRVVDGLLSIATGAQLKVLLFFLRYSKMAHDVESVARMCNIKPEEVEPAIQFWVKENIFTLDHGKLRLVSATKTVLPKEFKKMAPTIILDEAGEDFKGMIAEIQRITGKILNQTFLQTFYAMAEELHFSPEMIVQLAAYCNSIDKFNSRYLEKVSIDWHDDGITSFEQAEEKIRELEEYRKLENRLKRAFGIATNFSAKQRETIAGWVGMGLSEELILEAYNRCMDSKGKMVFNYINTILEKWHKAGYKKVADIRDEVQTGRQQHTGLSELEKMGIGMMQGDQK